MTSGDRVDVTLAYGESGLRVSLTKTPGFVGILRVRDAPALSAPGEAVENALANPIASLPLDEVIRRKVASHKDITVLRATIVISDITRPVPNRLILPPILRTLEKNGVGREQITILISTGIHRPNEGKELRALVGDEIALRYRCINHLSKHNEDQVDMGRSKKGITIKINRHYVEADIKILTGFIEPHLWAGYSGGRKAILPGISSVETMRYMHGYEMVADPDTCYGLLKGNPFHEAGLEVLEMVGADFLVNVTLDTKKHITGVWAGDPVEAHLAGCHFLGKYCIVYVDKPLDFAVTTNAGAPLDCNLYQTIKGVAGAAIAVRPGGAILIASACPEGAGSPEYTRLIEGIRSPEEFLERLQRPDFFVVDQWCAQETCQVMLSREIMIKTDGLKPDWLRARGFSPVADVGKVVDALIERYGKKTRWAVIPDGPLTILRCSEK